MALVFGERGVGGSRTPNVEVSNFKNESPEPCLYDAINQLMLRDLSCLCQDIEGLFRIFFVYATASC